MQRLYDDGSLSKEKQDRIASVLASRIRAAKGHDPALDQAMAAFYGAVSANNEKLDELRTLGVLGMDLDERGNPVKTGLLRRIGNYVGAWFGSIGEGGKDREKEQRDRAGDVAKLIDVKLEAKGIDLSELRAMGDRLRVYAIQSDNLKLLMGALDTAAFSSSRTGGTTNPAIREGVIGTMASTLQTYCKAHANMQGILATHCPELAGLLPDTSLSPYTKDDLRWSDGLRNHVVDELYALREAMRDRHLQFATEQLPELENEVWSSRAALAERAGLAREAEAALMVAAEYGSPTFTHDHDQEAERDLSKQMTM